MDTFSRRRLFNLSLIIVIHLMMIKSSNNDVQFINDDDTNLLIDITNDLQQLTFKRVLRQVTDPTSITDGSSETSTILSTLSLMKTELFTTEQSTKSTDHSSFTTPTFISSIISITGINFTTASTTVSNCSSSQIFDGNQCIGIDVALNNTVTTILNHQTNAIDLANNLSQYFELCAIPNASLSTAQLDPATTDNAITRLNVTYNKTTPTSFIMSRVFSKDDNDTVVGAAFYRQSGGLPILNTTEDSMINASISAAIMFSSQSLVNVSILRVLIIDMPTDYRRVNDSNNKTLASSVIVTNVTIKDGIPSNISVGLHFTIQPAYSTHANADYYCSFFDTANGGWNETGCSPAKPDQSYQRYSCTCKHLTSFALIWLPRDISSHRDAQDTASVVFQSLSIVCFLAIMIHAIVIRVVDSTNRTHAYDLLPLISCASTTLLFVFYIALGMTVYTRTESKNQNVCFQSASVLMFFVYFFLIFMFCTKTSVGYFNYLRFVYLFPEPSIRRLYSLLIGSFVISITYVAFAAGFNSNPSFGITQLYPYKLCWFSRRVIHYFLTIPVCIFLLVNIIMIVFVAKHIIDHVRNSTSPHQSYERMKRCVLVLLSSCITQGVGWLFGPFILLADSTTASNVLGWFFVVFNGLEGVWAILLYIIIRQQRMDELKRVAIAKNLAQSTKSKDVPSNKFKKDREESNSIPVSEHEMKHRKARRDSRSFDNLETIERNLQVRDSDS